MSPLRRALLLSAVCLAVSTTGRSADFSKGETLDFTLEWLAISAGSARMTIAPSSETHYAITSVAESTAGFSHIFRVRDELQSTVARDDFSTLSYRKQLNEGSKKKDETATIEHGVATRKGKQTKVPRPVFDPLSILFYFRMLPLAEGKKFDLPVYADGKLYTMGIEVTGTQRITTPLGTFDALVVEPRSEMAGGVFRDEKNKMTIWYSADPRHLPLRIKSELKFGSITATLKQATPTVASSSK